MDTFDWGVLWAILAAFGAIVAVGCTADLRRQGTLQPVLGRRRASRACDSPPELRGVIL
jgi:hypothetical protein